MHCGKRGWLTRREAKSALKDIYPGQFQEMQVYRCSEGGDTFHHGHRVPKRFRESELSSCRWCHRRIVRVGVEDWVHEDDQLVECGLTDVQEGPRSATPYWNP